MSAPHPIGISDSRNNSEVTPGKIDSRSDNESEFRSWSRRTSGFEARGFGAAPVCSRGDRSLRNCANRTRQRANVHPQCRIMDAQISLEHFAALMNFFQTSERGRGGTVIAAKID